MTVGNSGPAKAAPIEPTELRLDAGAVSLGCLAYSPPDGVASPRPIIMFHGLSDSSWSLHPLAQSLATTHEVFNFDLRGHGRSDWGGYTLNHFVGDIRGVVETLELVDPVVIGHSLGGQAASQFCGLYPEIPSGLVLIEALGPPPHPRKRTDPAGYQREYGRSLVELVRQPARSRPQPSLDAAVERFLEVHPLLDPDHARLVVENGTREQHDGTVEWRFDPEVRDWLAGHDSERAEQRWAGVTCPTFAVQGADAWEKFWLRRIHLSDELEGPMSDDELNRRLALFADIDHLVMEGAGHMIHYDRPRELSEVVGAFVRALD